MGTFSIWHLLIIAAFALLIFGGKFKFSDIAGDAAKGIKAFKDGLKDDPDAAKKDEVKAETKLDSKD